MRRIFRYFYRFSVTSQIMIVVICIILPINIVSIAFAAYTQSQFLEQGKASAYHTAKLYMNELDERIYSADSFLVTDLDKNTKALKLRNHTRGKDYIKDANFYWQELNDRVRNFMEADVYFFHIENEEYVDAALKTSFNSSRTPIKKYIHEKVRINTSTAWFLEEINKQKWLVHMLSVQNYSYGSMINLNNVEAVIKTNLGMRNAQVFIDTQAYAEVPRGFAAIDLKSQRAGIYVHVLLDKSEIVGKIPMMAQIGIVLVGIYILCIPALLLIIRRIFIRPMNALDYAMDALESGKLEYRMPIEAGNLETTALNKKYNSMAENVKSLKIEVYEKELERVDIEATNLRLQVNPHFILNCLNIIFSMAKSEKTGNIRQFTKYLSEYLRFTLWNIGGTVRLADEIKSVENYVQIQKVRFPGAFTFIENIGEGLENSRIPTLLILNFVENTIKYGLKLGSEIELIIIARRDEDRLILSICDTGNGMDEETLGVLRSGDILKNNTGKHIGIWNCRRRLSLMYGESAYMNITSTLGEGTQVFIQLPMKEE